MAASTAISSTTIVTNVSRPAEKADGEFSAASPAPIIATAVSKLAIEKRSPLIAPILPQHARCVPSPPWTIRKRPSEHRKSQSLFLFHLARTEELLDSFPMLRYLHFVADYRDGAVAIVARYELAY